MQSSKLLLYNQLLLVFKQTSFSKKLNTNSLLENYLLIKPSLPDDLTWQHLFKVVYNTMQSPVTSACRKEERYVILLLFNKTLQLLNVINIPNGTDAYIFNDKQLSEQLERCLI